MSHDTVPKKVLDKVPVVGPYSEVVVLNEAQRQEFLNRIAQGAAVIDACHAMNIPVMAVSREIASSETFARDLDAAKLLRRMIGEEIAWSQSTVGIDKVLTHQGRVSYQYEEVENDLTGEIEVRRTDRPETVKELVTSNSLLIELLRANYPEKYGRAGNAPAAPGAQGEVPSKITTSDDRARLIALLERREAIAAREPEEVQPAPSEPQSDEDLL